MLRWGTCTERTPSETQGVSRRGVISLLLPSPSPGRPKEGGTPHQSAGSEIWFRATLHRTPSSTTSSAALLFTKAPRVVFSHVRAWHSRPCFASALAGSTLSFRSGVRRRRRSFPSRWMSSYLLLVCAIPSSSLSTKTLASHLSRLPTKSAPRPIAKRRTSTLSATLNPGKGTEKKSDRTCPTKRPCESDPCDLLESNRVPGREDPTFPYRSVVSIHGPVGCSYNIVYGPTTLPLRHSDSTCHTCGPSNIYIYQSQQGQSEREVEEDGTEVSEKEGIQLLYVVLTKTTVCAGTGYKHQGAKRLGSRGNIDVLRMLFKPRNNITTRSRPTPQPPWGGAP